jgi:hypothetical protein
MSDSDQARHIAVYVRLSSPKQDTASQLPDLRSWANACAQGQPVLWYEDSLREGT